MRPNSTRRSSASLEDNPALGVKEETHEEDTGRYPLFLPETMMMTDRCSHLPMSRNRFMTIFMPSFPKGVFLRRLRLAARYIVGNLDSNGYLSRSLSNLVDDMAFGPGIDVNDTEAREALDAVRSLEPAGIGAFGLRDCLELQLKTLPSGETRDDALLIIRDAYDAFIMKHKHRIISQLHLPAERVDAALALILSLNPKPGNALGSDPAEEANVIIPDFIVNNEDGELTITLNNRIPELQIEQSFDQAMANLERTAKGRPKKGSEFIVSRYNDARDFIRVLTQRQQTMMAVMSAIVKIQKEYFLTEDVYRLRPMMIKNVSELTGLDLSVISRATTNKFVATPWGIFPLRFSSVTPSARLRKMAMQLQTAK